MHLMMHVSSACVHQFIPDTIQGAVLGFGLRAPNNDRAVDVIFGSAGFSSALARGFSEVMTHMWGRVCGKFWIWSATFKGDDSAGRGGLNFKQKVYRSRSEYVPFDAIGNYVRLTAESPPLKVAYLIQDTWKTWIYMCTYAWVWYVAKCCYDLAGSHL